jgi:hypothetical protein
MGRVALVVDDDPLVLELVANASLNCPWLQETLPPEQQLITVADTALTRAATPAVRRSPPR